MIEDLKRMQSHLKMREYSLINLYNKLRKAIFKMVRLATQNADEWIETAILESASTESERPAKRAMLFVPITTVWLRY